MYKIVGSNNTDFKLKDTAHSFTVPIVNKFYVSICSLEKLADDETPAVSEELVEYAKTIKSDPKHRYAAIAPLGASEYWGPNNRGDIWPEEALNPKEKDAWWGYKTFEKANLFQHHLNRDPALAIGDIVKSVWNDDMKRVEVIARFDIDKTPPNIIKSIDEGGELEVSMGAKVPEGDVCSKCGNRAKSRLLYCDHLKTRMASLDTDGTYIGAINEKPVFFDLSVVTKPAAEESGFIMKVATDRMSSAEFAESINYDPTNNSQKEAIVNKFLNIERSRELEFTPGFMMKLASYPVNLILDTTAELGIVLKPQEFQTLILSRENPALAELFASKHITFKPVASENCIKIAGDNYSQSLAQKVFGNFMYQRSCYEPFLLGRIYGVEKLANDNIEWKSIISDKFNKIAELYTTYRQGLNEFYETHKPNDYVISLLMDNDIDSFIKVSSDSLNHIIHNPLTYAYIKSVDYGFIDYDEVDEIINTIKRYK
jgi:hypothetical protein